MGQFENPIDKLTAKHYSEGMKKESKRPRDINLRAASTVALATQDGETTPEHKAAALLGRKGGQARAKRLTPEQRQGIAKKAAQKRWAKRE